MQKKTEVIYKSAPRKVRILTVVWGKDYIDSFLNKCIFSLLAKDNIPNFVKKFETEFVILTVSSDKPVFEKNSAFKDLRKLCDIKFIDIDDLICSMYGFVLTLAYGRGVIDAGNEQLNTHFIFLNSDFILSNGSFETIGNAILRGEEVLLAPSLRVSEEHFYRKFNFPKSPNAIANHFESRRMVSIAFKCLHPTVLAKTINQSDGVHSHPNQHYWRVNPDVLLGNHYLIFMMMIKPRKLMKTVESFVDYSFVAQLNPISTPFILDDSDKFFMLETQEFTREMEFIKYGKSWKPELTRNYIQDWIMQEQVDISYRQIVYKQGDDKTNLIEATEDFQKYIESTNRMLKKFRDYRSHPHWLGTLYYFLKFKKSVHELPKELPQNLTLDYVKNEILRVQSPIQYFFKTLVPFNIMHRVNFIKIKRFLPNTSSLVYHEYGDLLEKIESFSPHKSGVLVIKNKMSGTHPSVVSAAEASGYMIVGLEDLITVVSKKKYYPQISQFLFVDVEPIDIVKSFQELKKQKTIKEDVEIVSALVYHGVTFKNSHIQFQQNVYVPGLNGPLATFESENLENIFVKKRQSPLWPLRTLVRSLLIKEFFLQSKFGYFNGLLKGILFVLLKMIDKFEKLFLYNFQSPRHLIISQIVSFIIKSEKL